jgi:hypothetical protein
VLGTMSLLYFALISFPLLQHCPMTWPWGQTSDRLPYQSNHNK